MTSFTYDADSNLLTVTDAKSRQTVYTYFTMNRTATRKDPLLNAESYSYDNNGMERGNEALGRGGGLALGDLAHDI